jgi:hypothetical protein
MQLRSRFALAAATVPVALAVAASPASAATNDSFWFSTVGLGCGFVEFVDYGPGAPGGGNNDDYVRISDECSDGHGVKAYAWLNGAYRGSAYNGNGVFSDVVWDPFGNVVAGQSVGLKVCLVDGNSDPTPFNCNEHTETSDDG